MITTDREIDTNCFHCGEALELQPIKEDGKSFCCEGCRTVFRLLDDNDLGVYYDLEDHPGVKTQPVNEDRWEFLDHPDLAARLIDYSDESLTRVTLFLPAIHCSSCIWLLENLTSLNQNIYDSKVRFESRELIVSFNSEELSLRQLVEWLASLGYVAEFNSDKKSRKKKSSDHQLIYRLGIAGFCFGNIMLLSFPEYLGGIEFHDSGFRSWFGYLNILLAAPVFFYCSLEYFRTAWKGLKKGWIPIEVPISIGIIVLFGRSVFDIVFGLGPGFLDSFAGFVFLLLVGRWFQDKTYRALSFDRDYQSYFPLAVTKVVDGIAATIPLEDLKVGDRIRVKNGELIPADSILIKGEGHLDMSFITGEAKPVEKSIGDTVPAGGRQQGSAIELQVVKEVLQSYLTQLWQDAAWKKRKVDPLSRLANIASRNFTYAVLIIAALTALGWYWYDPTRIWDVVTTVLIVSCPCALALAIPFTYGHALRETGRQKLYLKEAGVVENLASVDTVVFDKTGTLTSPDQQRVQFDGAVLSQKEEEAIVAVCSQSVHPLSLRIAEYLNVQASAEVESYKEYPGQGLEATVGSLHLKLGSPEFMGFAVTSNQDSGSRVELCINGKHQGTFFLEANYRPGYQNLLTDLSKNYDLHLLSGDNDTDRELLKQWFAEENLHFGQTPQDKLDYVRKLEEAGHKVLMIGDGLNDSGALKVSHVGISLASDAHLFTPACDGILAGDQFLQLANMLRFSHRAVRVVKASFAISIAYNLIGLSLAIQGVLTPLHAAVLMPLSSISVVVFTSLMMKFGAEQLFTRKATQGVKRLQVADPVR